MTEEQMFELMRKAGLDPDRLKADVQAFEARRRVLERRSATIKHPVQFCVVGTA